MKRSVAISHSNFIVKACLLLWCLLALGGCAGTTPAQLTLPTTSLFNLYGQITISRPEDKTQRRFFITWQRQQVQGGTDDKVEIKTPFGSTQARLHFTPQQARLEYQNKTVTDTRADRLVQRIVGYPLPLPAFAYWITGSVVPDVAAEVSHNSNGAINSINQYKWIIRYLSRYPDGAPEKIIFSDQRGIKVQVHIRRWLPT